MSNSTRNARRSAERCRSARLIQAGSLLALVVTAPVRADSLGFGDEAPDVPVVIAATRLQQSLLDTPVSVSVIDRAMIRASGAREIPDVLRLVPGMVVARESGSEAYVSYHGTSSFGSRRMQVQVDGRSIYLAGLALVDWIGIPLDIEDIERIEVVRGPNSAAHGANSFLGVINIITRHPQDVPNVELAGRGGDNGIADGFGRLSLHGLGGDWSWSAFHREDEGYDINRKREREYRDDKTVDGITGKGVWGTARDGQLMLSVGGSRMVAEQERLNDTSIYRRLPVATTDTAYLALDWEQPVAQTHHLKLQAHVNFNGRDEPWHVHLPYLAVSPQLGQLAREDREQADAFVDDPVGTCLPTAILTNTALGAACRLAVSSDGRRMIDYRTDQNFRELRTELELSDTWVPNPSLRLVGGGQALFSRVRSETFLNGTASNVVLSGFLHGELQLNESWLLNLGGNVEHDEQAGTYLSPRVALSWQFQPNQVVRLLHSRAVRTPDIFENQADWRYQATAEDRSLSRYDGDFYLSARADGSAGTERIRSSELSYFGNFRRLRLDVKLFRDELDLVTNRLDIGDFELGEHEHFTLSGGEVGGEWRLTPFQRLLLSYARVDIDAPRGQEDSDNSDIVPRHSGSLSWSMLDPDGWRGSLTYGFYNDLNEEQQYFYDRLDMHVGRVLPLGGRQQLDVGVSAQLRLTDDPELRTSNGVDSRRKVWASVAWRY